MLKSWINFHKIARSTIFAPQTTNLTHFSTQNMHYRPVHVSRAIQQKEVEMSEHMKHHMDLHVHQTCGFVAMYM